MSAEVCRVPTISPREAEILKLVVRGFSNRDIAQTLGVHARTVTVHLWMIYRRAGIFGGSKRARLVESLSPKAERLPLPLPKLTEVELRIAKLVIAGLTNPQIATEIGRSTQIVKKHLGSIFDKCGVWSRVELAARFKL